MVIGKMRRACKRGLSIALAAAVMATSAPQLSVTAMAQEQGMIVQQEITDQTPVEVTEPTDTEGEDSSDEDSAQDQPADENEKDQDGENEAGEDQEDPDKAEDDVVNPDQEEDPEAKDDADGADDGEASDVKPNEEDDDEKDEEGAEPEEKPVEVEEKVYYASTQGEEETDSKDVVVYKSDFNELTADTELAKGTVRQLADGNMAIEYSADLSASEGWTSMFQADSLSLDTPYDASKAGKMNLSYDVYFEESAGGIGTVKAQAILRNTGDWNWNQATALPVYTDADLTSGEIADYQKLQDRKSVV